MVWLLVLGLILLCVLLEWNWLDSLNNRQKLNILFKEAKPEELDEEEYMERGYVYIFIRKDLTPQQMIVQSNHATWLGGADLLAPLRVRTGKLPRCNFVVIGVRSEAKLKEVEEEIKQAGFGYTYFIEPDLGNTLTSICTQPLYGKQRLIFSRYKKLGDE